MAVDSGGAQAEYPADFSAAQVPRDTDHDIELARTQ
jgi:hypothetical protein